MVPHRGGHRDANAGQGTFFLDKVLLVANLVESSNRVQEQSEIERLSIRENKRFVCTGEVDQSDQHRAIAPV